MLVFQHQSRNLAIINLQSNNTQFQIMKSEQSWLPATEAHGEAAITVDEYITAYLNDPDTWWWTTSLSTEPREMVLLRVLAIIEKADVNVHEKALGQLGAGPLEDMMSDQLLDELQAVQPFSPALKLALSCVRFQGGNNAEHTIVVGGATYKTALIPSGAIQGKISIIGSGVVVDPWSLLEEIERAASQGLDIGPDILVIADTATIVLPLLAELDRAREARAGTRRIGTTGRGIGPAYEDKAGRRAIRFADLSDTESLSQRIDRLLDHHAPLRADLNLPPITPEDILKLLAEVEPRVSSYVRPVVWSLIKDATKAGKHVLFEGAQAAMLDVDYGTYPYTTSSNTLAGQVSVGAGVSPSATGTVIGIVKAYTTRVGEGPFPTELIDSAGEQLSKGGAGGLGAEFGTNTGRKRRCGWFDAVLVRQSVQIGGIDGIVITKLDVLDSFERVKICTGYMLDGVRLDYMPARLSDANRVVPIYEEMPGWLTPTQGKRSWDDLPLAMRAYIRRIEELVGAPAFLVGTSPQRDDTIVLRDCCLKHITGTCGNIWN